MNMPLYEDVLISLAPTSNTITLPTRIALGTVFTITNSNVTGSVTVTAGSTNINGYSNYMLSGGDSLTVVYSGSEWSIR